MKKKNLVSMVVTLGLTASVMVGATLAYLTDKTEEVKNVFTIGNVNIDLQEPNWDPEKGENLMPGVTIPKDPTVSNIGENDTYVAVTVDGMEEMTAVGFFAEVNSGWVKVNADGTVAEWDGKTLEDGIYAYNDVLAVGADTPALFSTVDYKGMSYTTNFVVEAVANDVNDESAGVYYIVKDGEGNLLTDETFATESEARSYIDSNYTANATTYFELIVKAYAIQTTGFDVVTDSVYTWVDEIDFDL